MNRRRKILLMIKIRNWGWNSIAFCINSWMKVVSFPLYSMYERHTHIERERENIIIHHSLGTFIDRVTVWKIYPNSSDRNCLFSQQDTKQLSFTANWSTGSPLNLIPSDLKVKWPSFTQSKSHNFLFSFLLQLLYKYRLNLTSSGMCNANSHQPSERINYADG